MRATVSYADGYFGRWLLTRNVVLTEHGKRRALPCGPVDFDHGVVRLASPALPAASVGIEWLREISKEIRTLCAPSLEYELGLSADPECGGARHTVPIESCRAADFGLTGLPMRAGESAPGAL